MGLGFASLMGRLLIIPAALSGMCLSMLFGVPMADAVEIDRLVTGVNVSVGQRMTVVENQDQASQLACCATVRMEYDTEATTSDPGKLSPASFAADMPREAVIWKPDYVKSTWIPPNLFTLHQQFSLIGIIFKRE